MALVGALCVSLNALGFTNRSLRAQVAATDVGNRPSGLDTDEDLRVT